MTTYYPVIVTAAIFIALIFDDILTKSSTSVPINTLQGLICVGLMTVLSFKDMEFVSWGLLLLPIIVLIICYYFGINTQSNLSSNLKPATMSCSTPASGSPSTISVPSSPTTSAQISGNAYTFTPITSCST